MAAQSMVHKECFGEIANIMRILISTSLRAQSRWLAPLRQTDAVAATGLAPLRSARVAPILIAVNALL